jgi:hemoglobin
MTAVTFRLTALAVASALLALCPALCSAAAPGAAAPGEAAAGAAPPGTAPSLYERLGGEAGVAAIANSLIDRVAADPRIGGSFKDTNLAHIKKMLAEQICELSGGPCRYSGDSMKETHAGHHISEADFYGMVTDLRDILHERHVSMGATNELLRLLAPMKRDVVERGAAASR